MGRHFNLEICRSYHRGVVPRWAGGAAAHVVIKVDTHKQTHACKPYIKTVWDWAGAGDVCSGEGGFLKVQNWGYIISPNKGKEDQRGNISVWGGGEGYSTLL